MVPARLGIPATLLLVGLGCSGPAEVGEPRLAPRAIAAPEPPPRPKPAVSPAEPAGGRDDLSSPDFRRAARRVADQFRRSPPAGARVLDAVKARSGGRYAFLVEWAPAEDFSGVRRTVLATGESVEDEDFDEGRFYWEKLGPSEALVLYYGGRMLDDPGPLRVDTFTADGSGNMTATVTCVRDGHLYRLKVKDYEPDGSEAAD